MTMSCDSDDDKNDYNSFKNKNLDFTKRLRKGVSKEGLVSHGD